MQSLKSETMPKRSHAWRFDALGTAWSIETRQPLAETIRQDITGALDRYDKTYSRFRDDSLVTTIAKAPGSYTFPNDFSALFSLYETCYRLSGGRMTPLIGNVLAAAGYDKDYSFETRQLPDVPPLESVVTWDGAHRLTTSQPVLFDVGAAGKGQAVDMIAQLLESQKILDYVIDASGDIYHHRNTPERVGLEHPDDTSKVVGEIHLNNMSLCASASNRRAWHNWHHIIDAKTKRPVRDVRASWVIASTTLIADAVASLLFFVNDTTELLKTYDVKYVRLLADDTIETSENFAKEELTLFV